MNRILRLATTTAAALLLPSCNGCSDYKVQSTEPVPGEDAGSIEDLSNDWGMWLDLDVLPDGSPVIAYYDTTAGGAGFAVGKIKGDSVRWRHQQVDGYVSSEGMDTGDRGRYMSMAVGANGEVWLAYQDSLNSVARFAHRGEDGLWATGMIDGGGGPVKGGGLFNSITFDASGNPLVVHYDEAQAELRLARYNPATLAWAAMTVDAGEAFVPAEGSTETAVDANTGLFPKVVVSAGVEYIVYYDKTFGDLKMAWGQAGSYTIETIDSEGDVGQWPDVRVVDGQIEITYHDVKNQDLKYAVGVPGSWTIETADTGAYVGADSALFTSGSFPAVVYFDGQLKDMRMAWRGASGWENKLITDDGGEALGFFNDVIEVAGRHYAACYNYTSHTVWFQPLD
jgi:hypothetical protein